jgi:hypothetical protein
MVRVERSLSQGVSVTLGVTLALAAAWLLAPGPAAPAEAMSQDPATTMQLQQLQQSLNAFQLRVSTRLDMMQAKLDNLERLAQSLDYRLQSAESRQLIAPVPTPSDPIPGMMTFGRLVSETSESQRFLARTAGGRVLAEIGLTADGPGLLLYDLEGGVDAALVSTSSGPELRMRDADGILQTVLPQRQ